MSHPFTISKNEIIRLDDVEARELIARLCNAELRKAGVSEAAVTWGGDQRARDGGVDVRVKVSPAAGINGYIPSDNTVIQVKAVKAFGPSKVADEMMSAGALLPTIKELAKSSGAYLIVSTKENLSDSSLRSRLDAMEECLSSSSLAGKVKIDFYDSQRVAGWVGRHPSVLIWVKSALGSPMSGWQPYQPWAYHEEDLESEYLLDGQIKVFRPGHDEGVSALDAINRLRKDLDQNSVSVRLVGLSGVGKTRLMQALFDQRINTESHALKRERAIYTDLSDNPTPQPNTMLESLVTAGADGIIVVDNCGQETHRKLTEIVKKSTANLSLATLEYDIREDIPEGSMCYRLEASSAELIRQLLERRYPHLSGNDIDNITECSGGNSRVAFALASTSETIGELGKLDDNVLFRRLFIQNNKESDELLRCAEACSLLYSFDVEDYSENSELALLAEFAEVSPLTLGRHVSELQSRGLVQQRSKWRAMLPHAIANRLAVAALNKYPRALLMQKLVNHKSERVSQSFSRRIGFLHDSNNAQQIVQEWLTPSGISIDLLNLNMTKHNIFMNIAPVNPRATLDVLLDSSIKDTFLALKNNERSEFASLARSLAYEPSLFGEAIKVLMRFASVEFGGYNNQATTMLKSLFYCNLSGTLASPEQRAEIVRGLLTSHELIENRIGEGLLEVMLKSNHFSSSSNVSFGNRKRGYGWKPQESEDLRCWYLPLIQMVCDLGNQGGELGGSIRRIFAEQFPYLWRYSEFTSELNNAALVLNAADGWLDGWVAICRNLRRGKDRFKPELLLKLNKLKSILAPTNLEGKIRARVLTKGGGFDHEGDDLGAATSFRHVDSLIEARNLGEQAGLNYGLLLKLLPKLLQAQSNAMTYDFGYGVPSSAIDVKRFLLDAREVISESAPSKCNLIFIRGLVARWNELDAEAASSFLEENVDDDIWGQYFPELQIISASNSDSFNRLMCSLKLGLAPIWQYGYLGMGCSTDQFSISQIADLVTEIAEKHEGLSVAIEVLDAVVHRSKNKDEQYCLELSAYCRCFLVALDWGDLDNISSQSGYNILDITELALSISCSEAYVTEFLSGYVCALQSTYIFSTREDGGFLSLFFKYHPKSALDAIYLNDAEGSCAQAIMLFGLGGSDRCSPLTAADNGMVLEWCEVSPEERYEFIASICQLFATIQPKDGKSKQVCITELALETFRRSDNKREVLGVILDRIWPSSWSGSRAQIVKSRSFALVELKNGGSRATIEVVDAEILKLDACVLRAQEQEEGEDSRENESFE